MSNRGHYQDAIPLLCSALHPRKLVYRDTLSTRRCHCTRLQLCRHVVQCVVGHSGDQVHSVGIQDAAGEACCGGCEQLARLSFLCAPKTCCSAGARPATTPRLGRSAGAGSLTSQWYAGLRGALKRARLPGCAGDGDVRGVGDSRSCLGLADGEIVTGVMLGEFRPRTVI